MKKNEVNVIEGTSIILDISTDRVTAVTFLLPIAPKLASEVRIHVLGLERALMIDGAHIQWLSMQVLGLAFWIRQRLGRGGSTSSRISACTPNNLLTVPAGSAGGLARL